MDILKGAREEELRHGLERQLHQLQQQVDELRRSLRDQQARFARTEELLRQTEARLLEAVQGNEQNRQDMNQFVQVVQMDLQRLRNQLSALDNRVEDPMAAIRDLKAQLSELVGTRRREEGAMDELRVGIQELSRLVHTALSEVSGIKGEQRSLASSLLARDAALEEMRSALANVNSAIQLEEQRARRQVEEAIQRFGGISTELSSLASQLQLETESRRALHDALSDLRDRLERLVAEIRAVADREQTDTARLSATIDALAERTEGVRQHFMGVVDDLREGLRRGEATFDLRLGHMEERLSQLEGKLSLVFGELGDHGVRIERLKAEIEISEERWVKRQLQILQDHLAAIMEARSQEE
jgi:chromosome segregation ATPase